MTKLSSAQRFVLAEMQKSGPSVKLSSNYITTRYALSRKGLIELNQERGLYELTDAGRAALETASATAKQLKLWNGRAYALRRAKDPMWEGVRHNDYQTACVAAYSRADARRVIYEYCGMDIGDPELRDYWNSGWGDRMQNVTPERGLWIDLGKGPVRVV